MQAAEIFERLKKTFGDAIIELKDEAPSDPFIVVATDKIFDIGLFLRDDDNMLFDYLTCLSGMDYGANLGVVYHLYSIKHKHKIVIKVLVTREDPTLPTVERVWRSADWHEREAYDMYGFNFEGHHNLIRILCPYDWEGYPLRKDYETPEYYHEMRIPY
jgi:NADH-quinone oxidoreductase subunit C